MPKVLKYRDYLSLLSKKNNRKRRNLLIDYAEKGEIVALQEIVQNVLSGNIPLNKKKKNKLKKHKLLLRKLVNKCSIQKKKSLLKQQGGFLASLLPIALSLIGGLFGSSQG